MKPKNEQENLWEQRRRKLADRMLSAYRRMKRQKKIEKLKASDTHWSGLE